MKNLFLILLSVLFISTEAHAQQQNMNRNISDYKVLIAYFSVTGTTAHAAEMLAHVTGGELYSITPAEPYTAADIDWHNKHSRSSLEMNDEMARPAIKDNQKSLDDYDIIFIGYPIWWNLAPRIVYTFLESHDFKGKTLIPFATSGGSSISNSVISLKNSYPDFYWHDGRLLNNVNEKYIREWIDKITIAR